MPDAPPPRIVKESAASLTGRFPSIPAQLISAELGKRGLKVDAHTIDSSGEQSIEHLEKLLERFSVPTSSTAVRVATGLVSAACVTAIAALSLFSWLAIGSLKEDGASRDKMISSVAAHADLLDAQFSLAAGERAAIRADVDTNRDISKKLVNELLIKMDILGRVTGAKKEKDWGPADPDLLVIQRDRNKDKSR